MTNLNMNNKINFLQANSTTAANANAPPRTEGGELPKIIGDGGFSARFGNLTSGSPRKELSPETEALYNELLAKVSQKGFNKNVEDAVNKALKSDIDGG